MYEEDLPYHLSMRKSSKTKRDMYYYHDGTDYKWLNNFLKYSVGKRFNYMYKKVCEKFKKAKNFNMRDLFSSSIGKSKEDLNSKRRWFNFYVDDNGIIRSRDNTKGTELVKLKVINGYSYFKVTKQGKEKFWYIFDVIKREVSEEIYDKAIKGLSLDEEETAKIRWRLPYIKFPNTDDFKYVTVDPIYVYYPKNDPRLLRVLAERKKAEKKEDRERKRSRDIELENIISETEARRKAEEEMNRAIDLIGSRVNI